MTAFTPSQQAVVDHDTGNLAVLAVAGAGKTTTMTARAARLVRQGVCAADRMLLVTFTRKAAEAMGEKLKALLGPNTPEVRTFHAFAFSVLRHFRPDVYQRKNALLGPTDGWKPRAWAQRTSKELGLEPDADVRRAVNRCRSHGLHPARIGAAGEPTLVGLDPLDVEIYETYFAFQREEGKIDVGDLIVNVIELLRSDRTAAREAPRWFDQVMVDEYQDVDPSQEMLLEILCGRDDGVLNRELPPLPPAERPTLMVIGDDDQSVYRFRSAEPGFILHFPERWNARRMFMEENFRSHRPIISVANSLIGNNRIRTAKQLRCTVGDAGSAQLLMADDVTAALVEQLTELLRAGAAKRDCAILYRIHAQSCALEAALCERKIPYVTSNREGFYGLPSVKPLVCYLRLFHEPANVEPLSYVWNRPKRFLKSELLSTWRERLPRADALELLRRAAADPSVAPYSAQRIALLQNVLQEGAKRRDARPGDTLRWLLPALDYRGHLRAEREQAEQAEQEWEQAESMLVDADRCKTLESFLAHVDRMTTEAKRDEKRDAVRLMTLHAAKGLEFPIVFLYQVETERMPHPRGEPEEERRLVFVGVTRAQRRLYLCASPAAPSVFLYEMGFADEIDAAQEQARHARIAAPSSASDGDDDFADLV